MSDGRATSNIWRNIARIDLALLIGFFVGLDNAIVDRVQVSPHEFYALRRRDAKRDDGRCRRCFLPRSAHPVTGWVDARPMWNMRKATRV